MDSIVSQSLKCRLVISAPSRLHEEIAALSRQFSVTLTDTEHPSLAETLNTAFRAFPPSVKYIGWLGDDDLLHPDAVKVAVKELDSNPDAVLVFGGCNYIDPHGKKIGTNKSGLWAAKTLSFGPDLIPQPGTLWRRHAFEKIGGLSSEFDLAFDYDLFLNLKSEGSLVYLPRTLASFRWHPDSLSVRNRWKSVLEASRVRRNHYKGLMRVLWPLWEPWVIGATWLAGKALSLRLRGAKNHFHI